MFARGLAAAEVEKRKLEEKLTKEKSSKLWVMRTLAKLILTTSSSAAAMVAAVINYCGDLSIHKLVTLALLMYTTGDKVKPLLKLAIARLSIVVVNMSVSQARGAVLQLRGALTTLITKLVESLFTFAAGKLTLRIATSARSAESSAVVSAVRAAPAPGTPVSMPASTPAARLCLTRSHPPQARWTGPC